MHDRMNGFVVTIDPDLSIEQRWELARQIAELSGVQAVENPVDLYGLDKTLAERLNQHWSHAYEGMAGL